LQRFTLLFSDRTWQTIITLAFWNKNAFLKQNRSNSFWSTVQ
jgi:hypothetical protein